MNQLAIRNKFKYFYIFQLYISTCNICIEDYKNREVLRFLLKF